MRFKTILLEPHYQKSLVTRNSQICNRASGISVGWRGVQNPYYLENETELGFFRGVV